MKKVVLEMDCQTLTVQAGNKYGPHVSIADWDRDFIASITPANARVLAAVLVQLADTAETMPQEDAE